MRKTFEFSMLVCFLLLASVLMFTSCEKMPRWENKPDWMPTVHVEVVDPAVAPTCNEPGLTEGKHCTACGDVFVAQTIVDPIGHNYIDGSCIRCGFAASRGLEYKLSWNQEYYLVSGIGTCTDTDVFIPDTHNGLQVLSIESKAFYDCASITTVTIPNGVTSIGDYAFYSCESLISVTIPNSVTSIGNSAFEMCSSLTSMTIPESVRTIGRSAFDMCSSLTSLRIPNSVTSIGMFAFANCTSLKSVIIPNGVANIESCMFYGCKSLASVTIPNSVTNIGEYAFAYCEDLTYITFEGKTSQWMSIEFAFGWDKESSAVKVICSDGVVLL